jgi:hypothetical protein
MKDGLSGAYELILENNKEGMVKSNLKQGSSVIGDVKKGFGGPEKTNIKKPIEAENKINPGHGSIKTERYKMKNILPESSFDKLFKKQIVMEDGGIDGDESPLEMEGEYGFDEEEGDFPSAQGDDDLGEEVDVATELRLIIDRLTEVAEKLGAYDQETEEINDDLGEGDIESEEDVPFPEAVQSNLKPFKNNTAKMQQKNNRVQSKFNPSGKKACTTGGPGKGTSDGKLSPFRKTTLGPKMSLKADGKGPMTKPGASIFDGI